MKLFFLRIYKGYFNLNLLKLYLFIYKNSITKDRARDVPIFWWQYLIKMYEIKTHDKDRAGEEPNKEQT